MDLSYIEGADERLKIFVGLASEFEDTCHNGFRAYYEKEIVKEARLLVKASNK